MLKIFVKIVGDDDKTIHRGYLSISGEETTRPRSVAEVVKEVKKLYAWTYRVKPAAVRVRVQEMWLTVVEF